MKRSLNGSAGLRLTLSQKCSTAARLLGGGDLLASAKGLGRLEWVGSLARGLRNRHIILDLARHRRECRLYVLALLGGGLEEAHAVVIRHLLSLLERDCSFVLQISLVAHKDPSNIVLRVLLDLAHPGVHGVEGVAISDVVHDDNAVSPLVVARCDRLEALLARCVPNLQLAHLVVALNRANLEVDTDSGHEVLLEGVILTSN